MNQTPFSNQSTEHLSPDTVSAFTDGEVSSVEQQRLEHHLRECQPCTLRVLSATQLKAATARAGQRFSPPPDAMARLTARLHSQSTQSNQQVQARVPARIYSIRPSVWATLAAAILLTVSLLGWRQLHQTNTLAAELLDQHLATLSIGAIPQVVSTDRHTVKPWFQGRLPFSFNLPEATSLPPDTTLVGADLTYLDGQPAALLLFTIHKHEVSVFFTQRAAHPTLMTLPTSRAGFTLHAATTPNFNIIAVSDVNPTDLDLLVAALVQAQMTH